VTLVFVHVLFIWLEGCEHGGLVSLEEEEERRKMTLGTLWLWGSLNTLGACQN
jgi:hypothetical protein